MPDLSAVYAVATFIAVALAGLMYGNTRTLRDSNRDLRDRVKDLEGNVADLKAENTKVKADYLALTRVVTGEDMLKSIQKTLDEHHGEVLREIKSILSTDRQVLTAVRDLKGRP